MSRIVCLLSIFLLFACTTPEEKTHIIERHPSGIVKLEYTFEGTDTLNRHEVEYHENGEQFKEGDVVDGQRSGEWRSWYPNGSIWSIHHYIDGKRNGLNKVWYENGILRYSGTFENDERTGYWVFLDEKGDTVKTHEFPPVK